MPIKASASSSEEEEDPIVLSSCSSEDKDKGTTIPSQPEPDDNPKSSPPALVHRPVIRSTPKKPTSRSKCKAYKTKVIEPSSSSRKRSMG